MKSGPINNRFNFNSLTKIPAGSAAAPSIAPSGDPNTGIFFPTADTIAIANAGSESTRIDSSGNAGFGYTSMTDRVEINGSVSVSNSFKVGGGASSGTAIGSILNVSGALAVQGAGTRDVTIGSGTYPNALFVEGTNGNVIVGATSGDASAILEVTSTAKGFLPPRMTTTQRDAVTTPATGLVIYNTTTNVLNFYNGSAWGAV